MTNPLVWVARTMVNDKQRGIGLWLWCPGCNEAHRPQVVDSDNGSEPDGPTWQWNGRKDEGFGIEPSLMVRGTFTCHSFIRNGHWQFLPDCTHPLAGKTVPMVPLPDWLVSR